MLRIIVQTDNAGMAANVGGDVLRTFQTFDVDLPQVEACLDAIKGNSYAHSRVIGVEVLPLNAAQSGDREGANG